MINAYASVLAGGRRRAGPATGGLTPDSDFAARRTASGVFRSFSFATAADLGGGFGAPFGNLVQGGHPAPVIDSSVRSAGTGSMRFDCNASLSGSMWWTNFADDYSRLMGAGDTFYFQFLHRASAEIVAGFGPKLFLMGTGDTAGVWQSSCTDLEIECNVNGVGAYYDMYNACPGSCGAGSVFEFSEPFGAFDFKKQNGVDNGVGLPDAQRFCLYSNPISCKYIPANRWTVFQVGVTLGPLEQHAGHDWFAGSRVRCWMQDGIGAEQLVWDWTGGVSPGSTPSNSPPCWGLCAGQTIGSGQKYGKLWLLPYNQFLGGGASPGQIWYDKLILSTSKIPAVLSILP